MSFGFRAQVEYIRPVWQHDRSCRSTETLFLGGEYSDPRLRHPLDRSARSGTGLVLGGNKSLLFNVEYLITIAGPVRLVLFYDAGQVRDIGRAVRVEGRHHVGVDPASPPILIDPFATTILTDPNAPLP